MGACEAQFVTQKVNQGGARLYPPLLVSAIDLDANRFLMDGRCSVHDDD
jgi:hypothetical protein